MKYQITYSYGPTPDGDMKPHVSLEAACSSVACAFDSTLRDLHEIPDTERPDKYLRVSGVFGRREWVCRLVDGQDAVATITEVAQ